MQSFTRVIGPAASLLRANVDTDVIIRIERLTGHSRQLLGRYAFEALRYREDGSDDPDFVLNRPPFRGAPILIAGDNFGCGSSREGAVWALMAAGFRCVIAPSFGDIFYNNCFQNGMLPVELPSTMVNDIASRTANGELLTVDLVNRVVVAPNGQQIGFEINASRQQALIEELDDIGLTLRQRPEIVAWQSLDRLRRPWIWNVGSA